MPRFHLTILTSLIAAALLTAPPAAAVDQALLSKTVDAAASLPRLHALIVAKDGTPLIERAVRGPTMLGMVEEMKESCSYMGEKLIEVAFHLHHPER